MYHDYGMVFEEFKASLLVVKLGQALDGKSESVVTLQNEKPDKKKFRARYGKKIKRPGGEAK